MPPTFSERCYTNDCFERGLPYWTWKRKRSAIDLVLWGRNVNINFLLLAIWNSVALYALDVRHSVQHEENAEGCIVLAFQVHFYIFDESSSWSTYCSSSNCRGLLKKSHPAHSFLLSRSQPSTVCISPWYCHTIRFSAFPLTSTH